MSTWLKSLGVSKRLGPLAPGLCIKPTRIRRAANNGGKWLVDSDHATLLGGFECLMRTRFGTTLFFPTNNYFKYEIQILVNCSFMIRLIVIG
jgi:hypothetical protein